MLINMNNELQTLVNEINQSERDKLYGDLLDHGFEPDEAYAISQKNDFDLEADVAEFPGYNDLEDPTLDPCFVDILFDTVPQ